MARNKFSTGTKVVGFQFAGLVKQRMTLNATVSGKFTYTLTSNDSAHLKITPVAGSSNAFNLTPLGDAASIALTAQAKPPSGKAIVVKAALFIGSIVYVANNDGGKTGNGSITAYVPWARQPVLTINTGINQPVAITADNAGWIYVANYAGGYPGAATIAVYHFDRTHPARTISGITSPYVTSANPQLTGAEPLAVDNLGNIYCACNGGTEVDEWGPSGSTVIRQLTSSNSPSGINQPYSVVTDSKNNLYVANFGSNSIGISVFAPGKSTTPMRHITNGINGVRMLAIDKKDHLYATNYYASPPTINEYKAGASAPTRVFGSGGGMTHPYGLAVDGLGNVYATNVTVPYASKRNTLVEYTPTSMAKPARSFGLIDFGLGVWADPIGYAYAGSSYVGSNLRIFAPTGNAALRKLIAKDGITDPFSVVTWP